MDTTNSMELQLTDDSLTILNQIDPLYRIAAINLALTLLSNTPIYQSYLVASKNKVKSDSNETLPVTVTTNDLTLEAPKTVINTSQQTVSTVQVSSVGTQVNTDKTATWNQY